MATIGGFLSGLRDEVTGWGPKIGSRIQQASDALDNAWNSPPPAPAGSNPALRSTDPTPVAPGNDFERGPRRAMRTGAQTADFTVAPDGTAVPKSVGEVVPYDPERIGAQPPRPASAGAPPNIPPSEVVTPPGGGRPPIPPEVPPTVAPASQPAVPQSKGYAAGFDSARKALRGAKVFGNAAAPVAEFLDPNVRAAVDPESDVSTTDRLKQASRSALRVGGGILGAAGGAALGSGIGSIPLGIAGGGVGYSAGNKVADWMFGPEGQAPGAATTPRGASAVPAVDSGSVGGTPPAAPGGFVPQTGQDKAAANQFINGNAVPEAGGGYIRNNQTGAITKRTGGGGSFSGLRGDVEGGGDATAPLRKLAGKGAFGNIAALQGYGALERMKTNSVNAGLRSQQIQATNDLARARMGYEQYKDQRDFGVQQEDKNRGIGDKDIEDYVKSVIPAPATGVLGVGGEKQGQYGDRVGAEVSKLKDQINYTLGNRKDGKRLGQLGGAERQQLLMGAKMKSAIEKARGTPNQWTADFFGNKQADSKDLYSYMPAGVDGSIIPFSGGIRVKTMNGNTMSLKNAAGGGFNFTGPNDPADADVMALLKPHLDAYYKTQGK